YAYAYPYAYPNSGTADERSDSDMKMRSTTTGRGLRCIAMALALLAGCAGATRPAPSVPPQPVKAVQTALPNLFDVQRQIQQYIDSGNYEADVERVAHEAQSYLEQRAGAGTKPR